MAPSFSFTNNMKLEKKNLPENSSQLRRWRNKRMKKKVMGKNTKVWESENVREDKEKIREEEKSSVGERMKMREAGTSEGGTCV